MTLEADILPLRTDDTGTIRVANTRLALDVLLEFYRQGHSVEQLQEGFPFLSLADIHSVIGYYLRHRSEIDDYLVRRANEAAELRAEIERNYTPEHRAFLERLKKMSAERRAES
jgi:uncharacterized protein (DUF433 family)